MTCAAMTPVLARGICDVRGRLGALEMSVAAGAEILGRAGARKIPSEDWPVCERYMFAAAFGLAAGLVTLCFPVPRLRTPARMESRRRPQAEADKMRSE